MKIVSELLMLAPAITFVCLMLCARRLGSLSKCMWAFAVSMLIAFGLMLVGIHMQPSP